MSDRCTVSVRTRKADFHLFENHMMASEHDIVSEDGYFIQLEIQEVSYGGTDGLTLIAKEGGTFTGTHDDGSSYAGARFYGWKKKYAEVPTTKDGDCFITINSEGEIDSEAEWKRVKKFLAVESQVRRLLYAKSEDKRHTIEGD